MCSVWNDGFFGQSSSVSEVGCRISGSSLNVANTNKVKMPDLVISGDAIAMLTDPEVFRAAMANYYALQRAKKNYYETHKAEILAKKRQKYAAEHPEVKKKRKDPVE